MINIKLNIKIVIISIVLSIFMYPRTIEFLADSIKMNYIAVQLNTTDLQRDTINIDPEMVKIVIMFDDGWESVYSNAYKILEKYNFKASIPIIPSLVDEEEYMSYKELADLYIQGWDLLNHSYTHKDESYNQPVQLVSDFNKSREWMNNRYIGNGSDMVVMPYGVINPYLINKFREEGYRNVRTSDNIILLDKDIIEYYPIRTINLLTDMKANEVINILETSEHKTIIFILHKIEDTKDGYGMTYSKDKFEQILEYIYNNSEEFQVITYSQLFKTKG